MNTQEAIGILKAYLSNKGVWDSDFDAALTHAIEVMKRGAPEGWQLVPKEPTGPQIMAGIHCLERNDDLPNIGYGPKAVLIYKNMIEAYRE